MTIERFVRRLAISLVVGGALMLIPAIFSWASAEHSYDEAERSIRLMGGWIFAVFGAVMVGVGVVINAPVSEEEEPDPEP